MHHRPVRLALLFMGALTLLGCRADRARITPTTTGTDLRNLPRGKMTPLPFPGSDLARSGDGPILPTPDPDGPRRRPRVDPTVVTAAGAPPGR